MTDNPQLPANISRGIAKLTWPKVSPQFAFDRARPRLLRNNDKLPAEAQEAFRHIWDGVVVEVGQYFDTHTYRDAVSRRTSACSSSACRAC